MTSPTRSSIAIITPLGAVVESTRVLYVRFCLLGDLLAVTLTPPAIHMLIRCISRWAQVADLHGLEANSFGIVG
ncbi:MAG: hypothetical protein EHM20_07690 [Alphaproteobacteria bacterium]|nr:MAG: hypothetical protein EHM20_07690 [Alphaproteobacteria bacterium]